MSTRCPAQVKRTVVKDANASRWGSSRPSSPLYVPLNRASGVRARISRSTFGERCSTYQTSSSIRSSHGSDARPWI